MSISVVICSRNRPDSLRQCLRALLAADLAPVCEIIVIDQSSAPLELEPALAQAGAPLRYQWQPGRGLAKARNQALRLASGQIIAFTDDDCLVTHSWAAEIERVFREQPGVDGVFGRVLAAGDPREITYHHFRTAFGELAYATRPGPLFCSALFDQAQAASYDRPIMTVEHLGSGNNMAFRRAVFEQHGMFIELLGAGGWLRSGEDTELHYRLLRAHRALAYAPDVLIYHNRWMTPAESAALEDQSTVGSIAVYLSFVLRGDRYAWNYFKHRFSTVKQEVVSASTTPSVRKPPSFYLNRARAFAHGFLGGAWLALTQRPARLRPRAQPEQAV